MVPFTSHVTRRSGVITTTRTRTFSTTVSNSQHSKVAFNIAHLGLMSPSTARMWLNLCWQQELKTIPTGSSAQNPQQTCNICLSLPGISGILHHQLIQHTIRWWSAENSAPLLTKMSSTYSHRSDDMTSRSLTDWSRVPWCQLHLLTLFWLNMVLVLVSFVSSIHLSSPWQRHSHKALAYLHLPAKLNLQVNSEKQLRLLE